MPTFTLSKDLLENLEHKIHYCDILFVLVQSNPFKIAIDKSNQILDVYSDLASKNNSIKTWLDFMANEPSSYEKIDVELPAGLDHKELFLKVCKATVNQKNLLIYSHQNWKNYNYTKQNQIEYDSCAINMIDRDEAIQVLKSPTTTIYADHSVVAAGSSTISDAKNTNRK